MNATDNIEAIWRTYQTTKDCLKIASRSISRNDPKMLKKTGFIEDTRDGADEKISASQQDIDDYVIISLWAYFERHMFLQLKQDMMNPNSKFLNDKIDEHLERLKISDVLDVFKVKIDSNLIGEAKQIYEYRNWVAHRNPKKYPSANTTPDRSYEVLLEIIKKLELCLSSTSQ